MTKEQSRSYWIETDIYFTDLIVIDFLRRTEIRKKEMNNWSFKLTIYVQNIGHTDRKLRKRSFLERRSKDCVLVLSPYSTIINTSIL